MKIKVFKFEVTNCASRVGEGDKENRWYIKNKPKLISPEQIEKTVNDFCDQVNVIEIKIDNVLSMTHNNGLCNTNELWYTIIYNDIKKEGIVE